MGKTAKIILSIIGVLALACLVGSVVLVKVGKEKLGAFVQETQRQNAEARTWARGRAQSECVDEGLTRVQRCGDAAFGCQVSVQSFTSACLSSAAPTPGLCDGVPHPQDYNSGAQWKALRCAAYNAPQSGAAMRCQNLLSALQNHCARSRLPAPAADASVAP
ncbi:MAG: hypothetical protein JWM10_5476 [Myxococcaceae bacterium]|nr:hypothetical protein [Myxococcaceae bacterium]